MNKQSPQQLKKKSRKRSLIRSLSRSAPVKVPLKVEATELLNILRKMELPSEPAGLIQLTGEFARLIRPSIPLRSRLWAWMWRKKPTTSPSRIGYLKLKGLPLGGGATTQTEKSASGKSRNAEQLADFTRYCISHPDERFWQALKNWKRIPFLLASEEPVFNLDGNVDPLTDTFYWE